MSSGGSRWIAGWLARLKPLGELRDAVLVLAGLLYLLGYATWAVYSVRNGFGSMPVVDAQYVAAGIVPAFVIALTIGLGRMLLALTRWSRKPSTRQRRRFSTLLYTVAVIAFIVGFGLEDLLGREHAAISTLTLLGGTMIYVAVIVRGESAAQPAVHEPGPDDRDRLTRATRAIERVFLKQSKRLALAYVWFFAAVAPLALLGWFFFAVFPVLPQELGGAAPRCVRLDLDVSRLSPQTLSTLPPRAGDATIVRSGPLHLVFESSRYTLVSVPPTHGEPSPWWKIDNGTIAGVWPCESETEN